MEKNQWGKMLIYRTEKGETRIDVYFEDDNIWMTQRSIAELYQTTPQNITMHIKNIYDEGELLPDRTCKDYLQVQTEGERKVERTIKHYDFQMILAIGYRVRSNMGTHFRNWASKVLTEYSKKGFAMNDERLKNPKPFGADYFDELLERIRDIRASEKRLYEAIKKIYATSVDYSPNSDQAKQFFATVQNKMHYSVHGHTAAELLVERADATKDNMGLKSFQGAKVRKADVTVAKNYLDEKEIAAMNRITTMYLDYAEDQARRHIPMYMRDWEEKLNNFLAFTDRQVLPDAGSVSAEEARVYAQRQYELYDEHRRVLEGDIELLWDEARRIGKEKKSNV